MELLDLLRQALSSGQPPAHLPAKPERFHDVGYAIWRFLHAWRGTSTLGPDHAVLLRQIARWCPNLVVGPLPSDLARLSTRASVRVTRAGTLEAAPFLPAWFQDDPVDRADGVDAPPSVRLIDESVAAEGYLALLRYERWHSGAQKEAAWTTLTAQAGSTTLVALPTGAGKSLCFQFLARFGRGLTVVVVPTVALALDQWRSALIRFRTEDGVAPTYFAADDQAEATLEAVRARRTRLLFTSPEACVSGRLRGVLDEAARSGWLEHLVFDEAHLIDGWGVFFRVDFQALSTLRRQWVERTGSTLRTFLFSATFTERTRSVLKQLYWDEGTPWREFVSQRLRPELRYFARHFNNGADRDAAVLECVWHLPRPAILYTTEVKDAEAWTQQLREEHGFVRIECFNGETGPRRRREFLEAWREDRVDLMVATSAFGLGVDKPDVRTVIHACFPENLHRYYQEVGRGGRDRASATCLLLPTRRDLNVAKNLTPKLLTPERLQERWAAMWVRAKTVPDQEHVYRLRLDARPTDLLGARTYGEHVRWNKRLILQLLRAGALELLDLSYDQDGDAGAEDRDSTEWVTVRPRFAPAAPGVGDLVREAREKELKELYTGIEQVTEYLLGEICVAKLLQRLYGRQSTARVCGGCPDCRRQGRCAERPPVLPVTVPEPTQPDRRIVVGVPDPLSRAGSVPWSILFGSLAASGLRRFVCSPDVHGRVLAACRAADPDGRLLYRIDPLDGDLNFKVEPDEWLAVLHIGRVNRAALDLRVGRAVDHLVTTSVGDHLDADGRYPLEAQGVRLVKFEEWLNVHR